jgi:hypothetical protein
MYDLLTHWSVSSFLLRIYKNYIILFEQYSLI